ncbi:superoxide dismutase [Cu-Zn]-like isoform X1 [Citrus sinensis]|uniref:superoxide dismutase [Cu-Zn]-like isoform X1 n=1 Tax=Citrus sinensis TaxID=2711 RepID=UPI0022792D2B|nr:superoxide dismutase [Cu-Zn]-like isoform X1 [Citrus sinensis]
MVNAVAVITGTNGRKGTVSFSVEGSGPTTVKGSLSGLPPGDHALIIHTYGNISNDWISTGPPFKPAGADGFLENITVTSEGCEEPAFDPKALLACHLSNHFQRAADEEGEVYPMSWQNCYGEEYQHVNSASWKFLECFQ